MLLPFLRRFSLPHRSLAHRITTAMAPIDAKPFKLALVQLGGLGADKTANLKIASEGVRRAVQEGKADMVVLPVSDIQETEGIRRIHALNPTLALRVGDLQLALRRHRVPQVLRAHPRHLPHRCCLSWCC